MDKFLTKNDLTNRKRSASRENETNPAHSPPQVSKQKRKPSNYSKAWEEDALLKIWIEKSPNNLAFCKVCQCEIRAQGGITDLKIHAKTSKHLEKSNAIKMHAGSSSRFYEAGKFNTKVSNIELHLAAFCAEHNILFLAMDHLVPLLRENIPDSELLKKISCGRTKTTAILKNVLGETQQEEVCSLLRNSWFSLCVDESTDISTTKLLSLVVRVAYQSKIHDFFFDLIKVKDCDANGIYTSIVKTFLENKIDYKKNMIGYAADGANVMTGAHHSVATLLKKDCPNLIVFKCICHSFALCANFACKCLPDYVEGGARDIYNFIQNSPRRIDLFADLQILLDYNPRKILHPSQTRWLSLELTVNQLLSRFDALKLFFLHEDLQKFDSTKRIDSILRNPQFELYLLFLKFILKDINILNRVFQSDRPQIHLLNSTITRLYKKIVHYFVKDEFFNENEFKKIYINDSVYLRPLIDIYLGSEICIALTSTHQLPQSEEIELREHCLKFYVELCNRLIIKYDFENEFLKAVELLAPQNVLNNYQPSLAQLSSRLTNVISIEELQEVDDEWRDLRHSNFTALKLTYETDIEIFWESILKIKRGDGSEAFPLLRKIVSAVLCMPVATANVERIFSQINLNKTKLRNKLEIPALCGILRTKDLIKKNDSNCIKFESSNEMYNKINQNMYEK